MASQYVQNSFNFLFSPELHISSLAVCVSIYCDYDDETLRAWVYLYQSKPFGYWVYLDHCNSSILRGFGRISHVSLVVDS